MRAHRAAPAALLLLVVALAIAVPLALLRGPQSGSDPALADSEARQRTVGTLEQGSRERLVATPVSVEDSRPGRVAPEPSAEAQRSAADVCTHATNPACIRVIYRGEPGDHAAAEDIPSQLIIRPGAEGRYHVQRGWRITVVTTAQLPEGYDQFALRFGAEESLVGTLYAELVPPHGATYAFTVMPDDDGATLFTSELIPSASPDEEESSSQPRSASVLTQFLIPALRYDTLDISGAATAAGSYAFLRTAGEPESAIENYGTLSQVGVELRINEFDERGVSRAAFFATVEVGDVFDYRTFGLLCSMRFRITNIGPAANPRTFGIGSVWAYGGWCSSWRDDPTHPQNVEFVWEVGPGVESPDGIPTLLYGEPTGEGTYRLYWQTPYVLDVPAGAQITSEGYWEFHADPDVPGSADSSVLLAEVETESVLHIDPDTGRELGRNVYGTSETANARRSVNELFDEIVASIRHVPVPEEEWPRGICRRPADATCIMAVYIGSPSDYPNIADIPVSVALIPDIAGRYHIERGQQVTVVITPGLGELLGPFRLSQRPLGEPPGAISDELQQVEATRYTFTVAAQRTTSTLIVHDLIATESKPGAGADIAPGDIVATTRFLIPGIGYGQMDTDGEASQSGSFSFLLEAGSPASAVRGITAALKDTVELVIHSSDADGRSRASFYDTVRVGHTFDLRANGLDCSYRFMVTATHADRSTRSFGVRFLSSHESRCDEVSGSSVPAEGVEFVWGLRPGADPSGSRPRLFSDRPNGPGTYRLQDGSPCVLEVPVGAHLIHDGLFLGITQYSVSDEPLRLVSLRDAGSHSEAYLDPAACLVLGGLVSPLLNLTALFRDSFRHER